MKRLAAITMSALVALAPVVGAAEAQSKVPSKKTEQQVRKQQWKKGARYTGRGVVVSNHKQYKLKAPPKNHRWVRDGNNSILVSTVTGLIASMASAPGN